MYYGGIPVSKSLCPVRPRKLPVRLVRSGELIEIFPGEMPMQTDYVDRGEKPGKVIYYRMEMTGYGKIVTNPLFGGFAK